MIEILTAGDHGLRNSRLAALQADLVALVIRLDLLGEAEAAALLLDVINALANAPQSFGQADAKNRQRVGSERYLPNEI